MNIMHKTIADRFVDEFGDEILERWKLYIKAAYQFLAADDDDQVHLYMTLKDDEGDDVRVRVESDNVYFNPHWPDDEVLHFTLITLGLEELPEDHSEVLEVKRRLIKIGAITDDTKKED